MITAWIKYYAYKAFYWPDNRLTRLFNDQYWCCNHRWCYREATYDYRCPKHMDDRDSPSRAPTGRRRG